MKATETNLLAFLKKSPQFIIPVYQRTYSWTNAECKQLWDDIIRTGKNAKILTHFVGSIVHIEKGLTPISMISELLVIDGQQRLTTVMLLIEALARQLKDKELPGGFSARKLRNYYLLNPEEEGDLQYKLLLTQTDKASLLAIVAQKPLPADNLSIRVDENFTFFKKQVELLGDDLVPLCKGLNKLVVVDIVLSREHDNPQLIFESMNSTGKDLSQADLIRNFILMGLEPNHQTRLYEDHWRPMELAFGQKAYGQHFDGFMRYYLTAKSKTGEIPKISEVYDVFKGHAINLQTEEMDNLVADIHTFAGYYCAMALSKEQQPALVSAFADLRELKANVAFPLLLELYADYKAELLPEKELEQAVRLIESYVFRRAVCDIPTSSMNKTFATFSKDLDKSRYLESIQAHFLNLHSYRRFPSDIEFCAKIQERDLYNFRSRSYWLRRLENHNRKELVSVNQFTIEHVMPQNKNLSKEWQAELGDDWKNIQEKYLHRLGNLTLTAYNSEYSDRPFAEKRDLEGVGFRTSPLQVNKWLKDQDSWSEETIKERANILAKEAAEVWISPPSLPSDILDRHRSESQTITPKYTIDDHQFLAAESTKALFDAFRETVKALDPCITEEFFKHTIAYKAETNFVDVVPQHKKLKLILNLQFHELEDPRALARDVTNIGTWGNGDAEVPLCTLDELPYVMGLIRQAFEKQLGSAA